MSQFNFIGPKFDPSTDRDLFLDDDELLPIEENDTLLAHLLVKIGKFPSMGQAKKNGWAKPIPTGWSEIKVGNGKNRVDLFIWNPLT